MRKFLIFILVGLSTLACTSNEESGVPATEKHEVAVRAGRIGMGTRTSLGSDGVSVAWSDDDSIALWAAKDQVFALAGEKFKAKSLSADAFEATFSAVIDDMEEGTYTYYASYPYPASVSGGTARFDLPAVQDGTYRPEYDIMTAVPTEAASLLQRGNEPSLSFEHRMHILKIYIPENSNELGEPIERITLTFPAPVAGEVVADMAASATSVSGSNSVTLELATPIDAASGEAMAFINPLDMSAADNFTVRAESRSKWTSFDVPGRSLAAGHITPVKMAVKAPSVKETVLRFSVGVDHLGELLQKLTLRGENVDVENGAGEVVLDMTGGSADLKVSEANAYLAGRTLEAVFESENALVKGTVSIGSVETGVVNDVAFATPYLFSEDFSTMDDDSDHDGTRKNSNTGNKSAYSFLDGWSGARIRLYRNTSLRIACYRQNFFSTTMCYARVDSAPMSWVEDGVRYGLKDGANVSLSVSFKYGQDEEHSATGSTNVGQICYVGRVENPNGLSSESSEGTFQHQFTIAAGANDASSTNIPNTGSYVLTGCTKDSRISWRTYPANRGAAASNNAIYFYLDDVNVSITR